MAQVFGGVGMCQFLAVRTLLMMVLALSCACALQIPKRQIQFGVCTRVIRLRGGSNAAREAEAMLEEGVGVVKQEQVDVWQNKIAALEEQVAELNKRAHKADNALQKVTNIETEPEEVGEDHTDMDLKVKKVVARLKKIDRQMSDLEDVKDDIIKRSKSQEIEPNIVKEEQASAFNILRSASQEALERIESTLG